jgi:hypothetical protein
MIGLTSVVAEDSCQVEMGERNEARSAGECCVITKLANRIPQARIVDLGPDGPA